MAPRALPARGSKQAPHFEGKPGHLTRYFQDVEEVGTETERTTDDDLINISLRYLDIDEEQLWSRKKTPGMTFRAFKDAIVKLYPGADGDKMYTWQDLKEVLRVAQQKSPANRDELGQYTRDFQRITDFLKSKSKISDREIDEQFMRGIHPDFRLRVLARLQVVRSGQPSDEPYPMAHVIEAAEWAINGTPGVLYRDTDEDSTFIKKEMVELTSAMKDMNKMFTAQIQSLSRKVETAPAQRDGRALVPAYQNRAQGQNWNREQGVSLPAQNQAYHDAQRRPPPNNNGAPFNEAPGPFVEGKCGGCGDPGHFLRECPKIEEYIRAGKCKKNAENRIVLPAGNYIPRYITGATFIERIDKWHAQQQPAPVQANMFTRDPAPHMFYMATSAMEEEEGETAETMAYEASGARIEELAIEEIETFLETRKRQERGKGKEVFDGVQLPPRPPPPSKKKVAFAPGEAPEPGPSKAPPRTMAPPAAKAPTDAPVIEIIPSGPKPFVQKYRAPIEDAINTGIRVALRGKRRAK
jgi:hypothetical protein